MPASGSRRPVVLSVAVALVAVSGVLSTALGILILLSRYDVDSADVLPVSLVGIGIILFGLLTLAIASGIARGSRLSRLLLTVYLAIQFVLHAIAIATTDTWDISSTVQIVLQIALVVVVWAPPGSRFFRSRMPAADPYLP